MQDHDGFVTIRVGYKGVEFVSKWLSLVMEWKVPWSEGRSNICLLSTDSYRPPGSFGSAKGLPQLCYTRAGKGRQIPLRCFVSATHAHVT